VQLSVHVAAHAAFGACPEHVSGEVHVFVVATWRQPSASVAHVATVRLPWHTVPAWEQTLPTHVHDAPASPPVHAWFVPHVVVVTHSGQPPAPA
jgi:hypothetical protein